MTFKLKLDDIKLAVVGLGYVGLPLAIEFAKKRPVICFDIDRHRIAELQSGNDKTKEVSRAEIFSARNCNFTSIPNDIEDMNVYIITVPTPVDENKNPFLEPLMAASRCIGKFLKEGDVVIYESTVFPGATEEICVPILQKYSGLNYNQDFYVGYSPERINPGDNTFKLKDIVKVTSGSSISCAEFVDSLYRSIIEAGTFKAANIRTAEAAKVIENTQRDVNIALINELTTLFNKLNIDTADVLDAASTKWNFLNFRPGLVGGHCIGVDPYYLTHKAKEVGHHPEMILSGRKINDEMSNYVASKFFGELVKKNLIRNSTKVLIMGLTFKENCPDTRNTKVLDVIKSLLQFGLKVDVYDPWIVDGESFDDHDFTLESYPKNNAYDGVLIAVAHDLFRKTGIKKIKNLCTRDGVIFDLKYLFPKESDFMRL